MKPANQSPSEDQVTKLVNSLEHFTKIFYYLRTGRKFEIPNNVPGRISHFKIIIEALEKVFDGNCKRLIINVPPRYGKAIDVNTNIFTKNGFKKANQIVKGDELIGSQGWVKVTGVYPQGILPSKEILFSDNQSVICNQDHLWNVCDRYTKTYKTLKTSEIENTLTEADGRKHWRLPMINGSYGETAPFVNPYLLGCWLGDGHTHYAAITSMDEEIIQAFRDDGHDMHLHTHQSAGKAKTYGIVNNGFSKTLRIAKLLKRKHIPVDCFLWSKENRLALLQGLMDTDGTCGKNGQPSFTNINKNIIEGISFLINSLGGTYRTYTRQCGTKTLNIRLPDDLNPFRLSRKIQYLSKGKRCAPRRFISEIRDTDECEMVCFSVDSEDQLFAVGRGLILTHNTELAIHFLAWSMAQYPDSQSMYVSYSHNLAKKQTQTIREIMQLTEYRELFNVRLKEGTQEKSNFETESGGIILGLGAQSGITGKGAGLRRGIGRQPFGGCIFIDDIIKPEDALSDTIRESTNQWFYNTLQSRTNSSDTPIIVIGQRTHEDDLCARLIESGDWELISLPALDSAGNPLYPEMHDKKALLKLKKQSPWVYAAQYAQDPVAGGSTLFNPSWFPLLSEEPPIIASFVCADTAETEKEYNDASVFSFFGIYKLQIRGFDVPDTYALHWIDCIETRLEPKDLQQAFMDFYAGCMRYKCPPKFAAIEKKSTGVTLSSVLKTIPGLRIIDIERTSKSGSKATRFLEMQPFIAEKLISLPEEGKHTQMCLKHMSKITVNMAHRFDDICDTVYDAIKMALIDKIVINSTLSTVNYSEIGKTFNFAAKDRENLKKNAYGR